MKQTLLALALLSLASTSFAASKKYECYAETSSGEEILTLTLIASKVATLKVNGSNVDICGKGKVSGRQVEYGESVLKIRCKTGTIELVQDYDETLLHIEKLGTKLSDTTYMCN